MVTCVALLASAFVATSGLSNVDAAPAGAGFTVTTADLAFILKQIKIAEAHVVNTTSATGPCGALVGTGPDQIASPLLPFGLRTVSGICNNLEPGQETFGAVDQLFPRLSTPEFAPAYVNDDVGDTQPRLISNLIVDQTSTNPAAIEAAGFPVRTQGNDGVAPCAEGQTPTEMNPCVPQYETLFIPNVTTDIGLSPPFNGLFTIFGQFFDHGLDKIVNGGAGTVFVPLRSDDPLIPGPDHTLGTSDDLPLSLRFMVLTRGSKFGPSGTREAKNVDTPLVDLSQLYSSHPSHQVFLREYAREAAEAPAIGRLTSTGAMLRSADGGLPNWKQVKEHSATVLGLKLEDKDVLDVPMLATDPYGNFIPGPARGLPQYVTTSGLREGDTANPVPVTEDVIKVGLPFLFDIAHFAAPKTGLVPDGPTDPGPDGVLGDNLLTTNANEGFDDTAEVPFIEAIPDTPAGPGPDEVWGENCGTDQADPECTDNTPFKAGSAEVPHVPAGPGLDEVLGDNPLTTNANESLDDKQAAGDPLTPTAPGTYDDEQLGLHFIAGDGRLNENIALTAVHQVFHSEHDRLAAEIQVTLATDPALLAAYKSTSPTTFTFGERIFQAARFITEMEYQHLVFEDFARKVQPGINPFEAFAFGSTDVNPAISAEFAHAVYRFGHSMLTEDIARKADYGPQYEYDIPLLDGFLDPAEYHRGQNGVPISSQQAAGAIFMGMSDQVGNEIDEFVTETLRSNLLGLPLDLPALNIARGRSEGIPPLNNFRKQIYAQTNASEMKPYTNWVDFGMALKHPASLINFVAAYGLHPTIIAQPTIAGKREAARKIVEYEAGVSPPDSADFMFSEALDVEATGANWSNNAAGNSVTGVDRIDLWMGGLAERTNPFGGLLGPTFNYVFEAQLTNLQNGDRFYYLARTPGMNLRGQLEGNAFAELMMRNTTAHTMKADAFATADCKFQLGNNPGIANTGFHRSNIQNDPLSECEEDQLLIRNTGKQITYRPSNSIDPPGINGQSVYNGTVGPDNVYGGNDNDTFLGNEGPDRIEGGAGDDVALGGDGNDIITDISGDDVPKGGPGNDALDAGIGLDILMGGDGKDFTNGGANANETFLGEGDDFAIAGEGADLVFGDAGDDW
ncbi:MAG: peroxidase family protein, partial [Acidimicrobiales bacterium]